MYYNIKIVTKDSELSLESNDRAIIEREMDIYFARIFGASREFVSGIKDVAITKPSLRSINDIETNANNPYVFDTQTPSQNTQLDFDTAQTNASIDTPQIQSFTPDIQQDSSSLLQPAENEFGEHYIQEKFEKQNESNINNIFFNQQQTISQPIENVISEPVLQEVQNYELDNNKELEKEAQALFEELQQQVADDSKEDDDEDENIKEPFELKNNGYDKEESNKDNSEQEENKGKYQDIVDAYKEQILTSAQKKDSMGSMELKIDEGTDINISAIDPIDINLNQPSQDSSDENKETSEQTPAQETSVNKDSNVQNPTELTFGMFLGDYNTDKIEDEFIICAFYIKNILNQNDFTMKYLNSKLFQATGKIADTSIVDELIQKEYISIINQDDSTKYSITQKGEEYLVKNLQN